MADADSVRGCASASKVPRPCCSELARAHAQSGSAALFEQDSMSGNLQYEHGYVTWKPHLSLPTDLQAGNWFQDLQHRHNTASTNLPNLSLRGDWNSS